MEQKDKSAQQIFSQTLESPSRHFTISEVIDAIGYGKFHVLLSLATGLAFLCDSMEIMILSVLSPALQCSSAWEVTKTQIATLTTLVFVAMTITSPIWGLIADEHGRRKSLIISSILLLMFGLLTAFSTSYLWLVVLRFLCGCCISCMPQCVTLLLEYLPSRDRGKANLVMAMTWAFGGTFTILLAWGCIPTWPYGWRILIALCTLPVLIFLIISFWLPESILFVVEKGRKEETHLLLKSLACTNKKEDVLKQKTITLEDADATTNFNNIDRARILFSHILGAGKKKLTFLIWGICGLAAFNYYGVVLFATELMILNNTKLSDTIIASPEKCHSLTSNDYTSLLWISLAEFPATFISLYIMDIIGRKKTFSINSAIFLASLILYVIAQEYFDTTGATVLLFLARGSAVSYTWCCFIYVPEAYPTEVRSIAFGLGSGFIRIGAMVTPYIAQVLMAYSMSFALGLYILAGLLAAVLPLYLPIETMGRDLSVAEESQKLIPKDKESSDE